MNETLTDRQTSDGDLPVPHGAYSSRVQGQILDASICDMLANIVVKPLTARNLPLLKVVWTPGASLCGFRAEPLEDRTKTGKEI